MKRWIQDLLGRLQKRRWHVKCLLCRWEVHDLDSEKYALARGKLHNRNEHPIWGEPKLWEAVYEVGFTRA